MKPFLRAPSSVAASLALMLTAMPSLGCKPGANAAGQIAQNPTMEATGQSKCGVKKSQAKPLVVEWPAAERGALEARAQRGLVAVRYNGCEMEVLTTCKVDVPYDYIGITQKNESVRIKDFDDLYANLPVGAAKLEAKLEKSGQLNVDMAIVGRYESPRVHIDERDLNGRCEGASHVITGLTTGAFVFYSGAAAEVGAGMEVGGVAGGGASSTSEKELLNQDGDLVACTMAQVGDAAPPPGCGALLRVEVVPVYRTPVEGATTTNPITGQKTDTPARTTWDQEADNQVRTWQLLTYVGLGLGVAGAGALFGGLFWRPATALVDADGDGEVDIGPGSDRARIITQATAADALLWGGAAAAMVGLFLYPIAGARVKALKQQKAALSVAPSFGTNGAGATLKVSF